MESLMDEVQIEQKSYEMPPREGFTVTHFITVTDRSADFYTSCASKPIDHLQHRHSTSSWLG
jgi:hypothetical protein